MSLRWKSKASWMLGLLLLAGSARANMVITPWLRIFKGVDRAAGTNFPSTSFTNNGAVYTDSYLQVANCVRVDLLDPDVQFFTSPRNTNYVPPSSETATLTVSNFLKRYNLQIAAVANFYSAGGTADPASEGLPCQVYGLTICTGQIVSAAEPPDGRPIDSNNRYASILFATNKAPTLIVTNGPLSTNLPGIYTAVSGYYPVLTNGIVIGTSNLVVLYPDSSIHGNPPNARQPRTLYGLSQDRRYLYLAVVDGRQPTYSEGTDDTESGLWMLAFGAADAVNMDGGGSATMYMANCSGGQPLPLGRSSYIGSPNFHERITGSQFGIYALPLPAFVGNIAAVPGINSATITWTTLSNATSQLEYGLTPNLGTYSPFDSAPVTDHSVTLNGLASGTRYYFRVLSVADGVTNVSTCPAISFATTNFASGSLVPMTHIWKWQTNNLDGINWTATNYNDGGWSNGRACLWADNRGGATLTPYTNNVPNFGTGTRLPINPQNLYPFSTYYFRASFVYSNSLEGITLTFSNFLDDGAVFYLNGVEVFRTNMPPGTINNATTSAANGVCDFSNFNNNATCPIVFSITGGAASNLVAGSNTYAVELHNFQMSGGNPSPDVAFESAVYFTLAAPPPFITNVVVAPGETNAVFTWTTRSNSTSQILFGPTSALGFSNEFDANLVSNHATIVTGLLPAREYYFRIISMVDTNQYTQEGVFTTPAYFLPLVSATDAWLFNSEDVSGANWFASTYDDSGWPGPGPTLFYVEDNVAVSPRNTPLPLSGATVYPTYYFRTHFEFSGPTAGFALLFTNFIDDGAVFYLNGTEIQRVRMNSGAVGYGTLANSCPANACEATIDVPDVFRISGDGMTNLLDGENVLAVEVHQLSSSETDVVFGSVMGLARALVNETLLHITRSNNAVCVSWDGLGFTLQQTSAPSGTNAWSDVPGPVTSSPYCLTNPGTTTFFRLRN